MKRTLLVLFLLMGLSFIGYGDITSAHSSSENCSPLFSNCEDDAPIDCPSWNPSCSNKSEVCPKWDASCSAVPTPTPGSWQSNESTTYSENVTCYLVVQSAMDGISGYCQVPSGANLNHCVAGNRSYGDSDTIEFRCSKASSGIYDKPARNEVKVKNLGSGFISTSSPSGTPYWILCDQDMSKARSDKQCYDTDFSDAEDWDLKCKVDRRIDPVKDNNRNYYWYACA